MPKKFDAPHIFTTFKIDEVEGTMGKCGSSHSEQNNSSLMSRLGKFNMFSIEQSLERLIHCQHELVVKKSQDCNKHHQEGIFLS